MLERALFELGEAAQGVDDALEALDFDPHAVEACEERLFAIRALARKHGVLADDLGSFAGGLRDKLAALDAGAEGIEELEVELARAGAEFERAASDLSRARLAAATRLDAAMAGELAPLKMERALFETHITQGDPGPDGRDTVAFTVATNPGAPAGPLNKIASGGELSRFLLALKVVLSRGADALTLIFDEIDRGVGGGAAGAVGRRLAQLAEGAQVLVVTHSPQVAARGATHFRVAKSVQNEMTPSPVRAFPEAARLDEISRMIAGAEVTDAARAAAKSLLAG